MIKRYLGPKALTLDPWTLRVEVGHVPLPDSKGHMLDRLVAEMSITQLLAKLAPCRYHLLQESGRNLTKPSCLIVQVPNNRILDILAQNLSHNHFSI